jgi:tetratricopeptide (TPR) repeat protein
MLANAELDSGNYAKTLDWAKRALEVDPKIPEAYVFIGGAEQQLAHLPEAAAAYQKYLEMEPQGRWAGELRSILRRIERKLAAAGAATSAPAPL